MYLVVAERQGISFKKLRGTLQNDILKEYIAQKEWICPPAPSLKLINDTIRFCVESAPLYHPVSISGYHIREAGSTAVQEIAFTLYDGLTYVKSAIDAGLSVDDFAPRLSFFFNAHNDFFEEIAKYRAARRLWAGRSGIDSLRKPPRSRCASTRKPRAARYRPAASITTWFGSRFSLPRCSAARSPYTRIPR
jgi:methylmalonyl-CoA mutase N-terminal domain/subunit